MTPDTDSPDGPDRIARPSGRAILLGVLGVLFAGAAVAAAGFLAGGADFSRAAPQAVSVDTQHGQLSTFPLHDEKPMKGIGKATHRGGSATPTATPAATPTSTPAATPTSTQTPTPTTIPSAAPTATPAP